MVAERSRDVLANQSLLKLRCSTLRFYRSLGDGWGANRVSWTRSGRKAIRWGVFILCHALVASLLIGAIQFVQWLVILTGDHKLFDVIPLRYIFDAMDAGILIAFVVLGTLESVRVFREQDDGE